MTDKPHHTPGPWISKQAENGVNHIGTQDGRPVALAYTDYGNNPNQANARLIAAAPDLLEVLEEIAESGFLNESAGDESGGHLLADARAAIRKARGAA